MRDRELRVIDRMLSLNTEQYSSVNFSDQWKVLVYDNDCRDIISPLLNVGALRAKGVTLHMLLHSDREAVPDAPAVYFVRPTEANLKRIAEDCAKNLYRSVYLNFVTRVERPLLEKFAQDLVSSNSVGMVTKIVDQYLDVISLEPNLFTLNMKNSFSAYNAKPVPGECARLLPSGQPAAAPSAAWHAPQQPSSLEQPVGLALPLPF